MKKTLILVLLTIWVFYSLAEKSKKPMDIVDSNIPDDAPQIKISLADEEDANADATITMDLDSEQDDDDDDDDLPIRTRKLPKSKSEDIHSFL